MHINLKGTELDITPSLKKYIEDKLEPLQKFVKKYEERSEIQLFVEVARTTKHHKKGDVFYAEAVVQLPKKVLRGEVSHRDARGAVDLLKDILKRELETYKEKRSWTR